MSLVTSWGLSPNHTKNCLSWPMLSRSNHDMSTPLLLLQGDKPCLTQCWSHEQQCSSKHKPTSQASSEQLTQGVIQPALADPILNSHHLCPKVMWITPVSYGLTPQTRTWMSWLPYRRKFSTESNLVTCNWFFFTLRDVLLAMLNNHNRNCLAYFSYTLILQPKLAICHLLAFNFQVSTVLRRQLSLGDRAALQSAAFSGLQSLLSGSTQSPHLSSTYQVWDSL